MDDPMPDEHNAFDLASLAIPDRDDELPGMWERADFIGGSERRIDPSGKPLPENVRVQLNSGIEIKCDLCYDGLDPDQTRRFLVICEMDWENYFPKTMIVGLHPTDTTLVLRVPGATDNDHQRYAHMLNVVSEKIIETR